MIVFELQYTNKLHLKVWNITYKLHINDNARIMCLNTKYTLPLSKLHPNIFISDFILCWERINLPPWALYNSKYKQYWETTENSIPLPSFTCGSVLVCVFIQFRRTGFPCAGWDYNRIIPACWLDCIFLSSAEPTPHWSQ